MELGSLPAGDCRVLTYIGTAGRRTGAVKVRFGTGLSHQSEDITMSRFRCAVFSLLTLSALAGCDYFPNSVPPNDAGAAAKVALSDPAPLPNS